MVDAMEKKFAFSRWLSFKQANDLGGKIKKGEKASMIIFYKKTFIDKDGNKWTPQEVERFNQTEITAMQLQEQRYLTSYNVFNIAQVEGLPEEFYTTGAAVATQFETAERLFQEANVPITWSDDDAFYSPSSDSFVLPLRENFRTDAAFYRVAFHELIHWTGHKSRLDRAFDNSSAESYATEELIADLGCAFIMSSLGFDGYMQSHATYLMYWIKQMKADNKIIFKVAAKAQQAADYILKQEYKSKEVAA